MQTTSSRCAGGRESCETHLAATYRQADGIVDPDPGIAIVRGLQDCDVKVSRLGDSPGFDSGNPRTVAIAKTAHEIDKTG